MEPGPLTWTHFGWLLSLIAAWSLVIIATTRWAIGTAMKGVGDKFEEMGKKIQVSTQKQQDLEREILEVKADLPICYVRREDFIRQEVTINTKLDRLRDMMPNLDRLRNIIEEMQDLRNQIKGLAKREEE